MKTTKIFILLLLVFLGLTSCDKKLTETGDPTFLFKDATELTSPTGYTVGYAGNTTGQKFIIRSNRSWEIVEKTANTWVKFFPNEGDEDGIVKVIVQQNNTFVDRQMQFSFIVDGEEQTVLFTVNQDKATPYITISDIIAGKNINLTAQDVTVNVKANVAYTYSSDASWLTFKSSVEGPTSTDLTFTATAFGDKNSSRTGNISFICEKFPELNAKLVVRQGDGILIFSEDFSWLSYGVPIFYTTTGETRYDVWTATEKAKGWTTTVNPFYNFVALYSRPGFVKLGLTSYGGDLISPKLSMLVGTKNLVVRFKAVPYMTATGTKDDNTLIVNVIGAGTVGTSSFTIDNWPNYTTDPTCTAIWADIATERSFTITGATSETQIKFLGKDYDLRGVGAGKNRIFMDDIRVFIPF